jgi:hypothetical protein
MYKIIGSDGKEYGPISLELLQQWKAEGRIQGQTQVLGPGATQWQPAAAYPELGFGAAPAGPAPAYSPRAAIAHTGKQEQGLAIVSLVLGICSFICFGLFAGIPAIICGHIARGRAQREPARYGGAGLALAGLIMGYCSIIITFLILPALLLPALSRAKSRAQEINCMNNMKQLGLAFRTWGLEHNGEFPFNVSTAKGGTMELSQRDGSGLDQNSYLHFQVMSNELATPRILVCVADSSKVPAANFGNLTPANVSYQIYSGREINDKNPQQTIAICPIHGTVLRVDGSVQQKGKSRHY